jgi:hypothetical protein
MIALITELSLTRRVACDILLHLDVCFLIYKMGIIIHQLLMVVKGIMKVKY